MAAETSRRSFAIAREIYLRGNPGLSRFSRGRARVGKGRVGDWPLILVSGYFRLEPVG